MNGLKLAFAIRDRWPPIAIVVASGRIRPPREEMAKDARFLRQPCSESEVLEAVRHAAAQA